MANGTNDFAGNLTINSGAALQVDTAGAIPDASSVTANGLLLLNGVSETINALNGAGGVSNSAGANTLTVGGANGTGTFTGLLSNGTGALSLAKTGTGTQTLTPITGPVIYNATYVPATPTTVAVIPYARVANVTGIPAAIMNGNSIPG